MKLFSIVVVSMFLGGCILVPVESSGGKAGGDTVVVCHKGKKTMELPREAAGGHLNHGDRYGPC